MKQWYQRRVRGTQIKREKKVIVIPIQFNNNTQKMSHDQIAQAFVSHYYNIFDTNRAQLETLYKPESMLTWEGQPFQGVAQIIEKIVSLPFQTVKHVVTTQDAQPTPSGVLIFVCGTLAIDNDYEHPLKFSQTFQLLPIPGQAGGFFVFNDMFRLNIG
eukprot:TRINITY_DN15027_c0_g1_i2.p1 TRINITY_DN15027_c0_g1~~TRINITY_DN15027_c0_g1_i2.p1  ORF type:complete len:158 (+),score=35.37 TRINITY_DN15027_c0_g1_i2:77-550(+)